LIRRIGWAAVLATILMVATPSAALAHAGFVSSTPEPGAILGSAPGQVSVGTPDGSSVPGRVVGDDGIVVDLTTNQTGVYEVDWTAVSLVDGHTLSGSFAFGVGVSPGAGAVGGTTDEPTGWTS